MSSNRNISDPAFMTENFTETVSAAKRIRVRKDKTNPRRIAYVCLLLFAVPPSWPLLVLGALLALSGIVLHGWAAGYLARAGYEDREKILTVRGPYRHNRNPYYVAQMTMDLGFFCMAGLPLFYLLYFPVIFSVYRRWVLSEESFLREEFGDDYRAFSREAPRWRVRATPAPARGREQRFTWAMYRQNHELHRTLSHLLLLGIFVGYALGGNPFAAASPLVLATVVLVLTSWLLIRDISPLDTRELSQPWVLLAVAIAGGGMVMLRIVPLWEAWSESASWLEIGVALVCGFIVAASTIPRASNGLKRSGDKRTSRIFSNPLCQWYLLALGLGFLSCQLGAVWLASFGALTLWALNLSGVFEIRGLPARVSSGVAVLVLFVTGVLLSAQYLLD